MCFRIAVGEVSRRHWICAPPFIITYLQDPQRQDLKFVECNSKVILTQLGLILQVFMTVLS